MSISSFSRIPRYVYSLILGITVPLYSTSTPTPPGIDIIPHLPLFTSMQLVSIHSSTCLIFSSISGIESPNIRVSSAKLIPGVFSLQFGIVIPLILSNRSSMNMSNSSGDVGHPCLTPLSSVNGLYG